MTTASLTPKQEVEKLLNKPPNNSTLEDVQCHFYVLEKVKRRHADVEVGRGVTHDEPGTATAMVAELICSQRVLTDFDRIAGSQDIAVSEPLSFV